VKRGRRPCDHIRQRCAYDGRLSVQLLRSNGNGRALPPISPTPDSTRCASDGPGRPSQAPATITRSAVRACSSSTTTPRTGPITSTPCGATCAATSPGTAGPALRGHAPLTLALAEDGNEVGDEVDRDGEVAPRPARPRVAARPRADPTTSRSSQSRRAKLLNHGGEGSRTPYPVLVAGRA
jgi:hypothetical protein